MFLVLFILPFLIGYCLVKLLTKLKNPIIIFSGSFLFGILLSGSLLYILDILFVKLFSNYILGTVSYSIIALTTVIILARRFGLYKEFKNDLSEIANDIPAILFLMVCIVFSCWLYYHSLSTNSVNTTVAGGCWSDTMFHNATARTVSMGENIPVQFPYFAANSKYHFMFDYYSGKIGQLGINTVHALNLMSILTLIALFLLILEFGRTYFKSTAVGILGASMLMFHSSLAVFPWLNENLGSGFFEKILRKSGWLSQKPFEDWGLFNLNVFINQRHFPFSLGLLLFIVMVILHQRDLMAEDKNSFPSGALRQLKPILLIALTAGLLPFWNAVAAGISIIIIGMFAFSMGFKNKNFILMMIGAAFLAGIIASPQLLYFKSGNSVLSEFPKLHIGYYLEHYEAKNPIDLLQHGIKKLPELLVYYLNVLGIKSLLILAAFFIINLRKKYESLIFAIPFLLANLFQFGYILYDNNKLMIITLVFLNCFAAYFIVWMYNKLKRVTRILPLLLCSLLIFTVVAAGILDFMSIKNLGVVEVSDSSEFKKWIVERTDPKSIFLSNFSISYSDNPITTVTQSGRKLYVNDGGSAVFYLDERLNNAKEIFAQNRNINEIKDMIRREKIDYILIDNNLRNNQSIQLNEQGIHNNFKVQFQGPDFIVYAAQDK
ncbi:MAG: hypothetical protein N2645_11140 [Clostridia bacterium]|nr:hypothetical protein [Clostridia bacterium]